MIFGFPLKKTGDSTWFLSEQDNMLFGKIVLVTMAMSETECNVWYNVEVGKENFAVKESQILKQNQIIPVPKYSISDNVSYEYLSDKNKQILTTGIITDIEIGLDSKSTYEIRYFMKAVSRKSWVLEDEIISFNEADMLFAGVDI